MASFKVIALPISAQADSAAKVITQEELTYSIALRKVSAETDQRTREKRAILGRLVANSTWQLGVDLTDAKKDSRRSPERKEVPSELASTANQSSSLQRNAKTSQEQNGHGVAESIDDEFEHFGRKVAQTAKRAAGSMCARLRIM